MTQWTGRLALAVLSLSVLARAASAQAYEPAYAADRPAYVEGHGYEYGYESGAQSSRYETSAYEGDRYGERREQTSGGSEAAYESGYGSAYAYRSEEQAGYDERYIAPAEAPPCDWRRVPNPQDPDACPAGWGTVTLSDGFFSGGGGVGDGYGYAYGGGGGGGGYAYAGAGASASAYASASARVSIGYRGGGKGGHKPGKPRGGCGCKH